MENGKKICSLTPHLDIENNIQRVSIPYYINYPDDGVNDDTGLIFTISGYGFSPFNEYESKLRDYLSNKYNCIAVGVDYFGCDIKFMRPECFRMSEDFLNKFEEIYKVNIGREEGVSLEQTITQLADYLLSRGIDRFDQSLYVYSSKEGFYQSFGLLPALDYLQVLAELLECNNINKKRLYVLGSSYGGYIGLMLGKLAPNTFRMIIDNSGFVEARERDMLGAKGGGGVWRNVNGCAVPIGEYSKWSNVPGSDNYIDEHHKDIRNMLLKEHIYPSKTEYYCCHSIEDGLIPSPDKEMFKTLRPDMDVEVDIVTEEKIDGRLFKTLEHGMAASLRGLFDRSYIAHANKDNLQCAETDFDLGSQYTFPCNNGVVYSINFSSNNVQLELIKS